MNTLKNLALTALLAVAAVGCKNDSPTPMSKSIDNSPCYTGKVLYKQNCGSIVVQVENAQIGISDTVGSRYCIDYPIPTKVYDNVLCLIPPNTAILALWNKADKIYFTVESFLEKDNKNAEPGYLGCAEPAIVTCQTAPYIPNKFVKIKNYSLVSCEDIKTK